MHTPKIPFEKSHPYHRGCTVDQPLLSPEHDPIIEKSLKKTGVDITLALEEVQANQAVSKAIDESAKREYSPVINNGPASSRYEENKLAVHREQQLVNNSENLVPGSFLVHNKSLLRNDSSPDRFERDQGKLDSVRFDMRLGLEK